MLCGTIPCALYHYSHNKCIQFRSISSTTATHFTKIFPEQVDITGSPGQAFHMQENHDKYFKYLIGGISAGTIAAIGTIASGSTFQYLYAPQVYHDLGGKPVGFVGNASNKIGEFSCVYISLSLPCLPPMGMREPQQTSV